jgi:hypothetical protein
VNRRIFTTFLANLAANPQIMTSRPAVMPGEGHTQTACIR